MNLLLFSSYIKTTRTRPCRGTIISRVYPKTFRRKLTLLAVRGFELGESVPLNWARLAHARWLTDWYEKWGIKTFYPSESCRFPSISPHNFPSYKDFWEDPARLRKFAVLKEPRAGVQFFVDSRRIKTRFKRIIRFMFCSFLSWCFVDFSLVGGKSGKYPKSVKIWEKGKIWEEPKMKSVLNC